MPLMEPPSMTRPILILFAIYIHPFIFELFGMTKISADDKHPRLYISVTGIRLTDNFLNLSSLTCSLAKVVKLCTSYLTMSNNLDLYNNG